MFVDMLGKSRLKIGLHTHTTLSDGRKTPEEAALIYAREGYDAIAITDHWIYGREREIEGLKIISGCEYNFGGGNTKKGVYHILGIGMTSDPEIPEDWQHLVKTSTQKAAEAIKMIKQHNGIAVLAHPAWSLNNHSQILKLGHFDALEIYNSVSEHGMSDRPYAGLIADMLATDGIVVPLLATDDTHYYDGDQFGGAVMVEATDFDSQSIVRAILAGRFYSTQGPEIHIRQTAADKIRVICSPAEKIVFLSNLAWTQGRVVRGENLVEAEYTVNPDETFVRAEVTDAAGKKAWSNIISLG